MSRRKIRFVVLVLVVSLLLTGAKFADIVLEKVSKDHPFVNLSVIIKEGGNGKYPEESIANNNETEQSDLEPIAPLDPINPEVDDLEPIAPLDPIVLEEDLEEEVEEEIIIQPQKTSISIEVYNRNFYIDGEECEDFEAFKNRFNENYSAGMSVDISNEFAEYHTYIDVAEFLNNSGIEYADSFKEARQ